MSDFLTSAFQHIRDRLLASSRRLVAEEDAKDALQEAFCRLWTNRHAIESESQAEGMLTVTTMRLSIDTVRRTASISSLSNLPEVPNIAENVELQDDREEILEKVNRLIASRLSERDREILLHRDRDEWEFSDIAKAYGVSEANARLIVSRARNTIRNIYRDE